MHQLLQPAFTIKVMTDKYSDALLTLHKALSSQMRTRAEMGAHRSGVTFEIELRPFERVMWNMTPCLRSISVPAYTKLVYAGGEAEHSSLVPASHLPGFPPNHY